jgi:hypothetical protein
MVYVARDHPTVVHLTLQLTNHQTYVMPEMSLGHRRQLIRGNGVAGCAEMVKLLFSRKLSPAPHIGISGSMSTSAATITSETL